MICSISETSVSTSKRLLKSLCAYPHFCVNNKKVILNKYTVFISLVRILDTKKYRSVWLKKYHLINRKKTWP